MDKIKIFEIQNLPKNYTLLLIYASKNYKLLFFYIKTRKKSCFFKKCKYIWAAAIGQPILVNQSNNWNMLENLSKIKIENPVDLIISQIRDLISSGHVKPGEKLPPERKLAEHFGVSRSQVREAINKLQFYGILNVQPQSGTTVNGIGITALEGLITDILKIEKVDFKSLIDTRVLLEKEAARLAALNRTKEDLFQLELALHGYKTKLLDNNNAVEEDLLFHIKIAEASKNTVLKSLMLIITPDIVKNFIDYKVCDKSKNLETIEEHERILEMIINQDELGAEKAMAQHLLEIKEFSKNYKINII